MSANPQAVDFQMRRRTGHPDFLDLPWDLRFGEAIYAGAMTPQLAQVLADEP